MSFTLLLIGSKIDRNIRYYSYGASLEPSSWSVFALSHSIIKQREGGINDGLVRYNSSSDTLCEY